VEKEELQWILLIIIKITITRMMMMNI
jgi:hypothetical protein